VLHLLTVGGHRTWWCGFLLALRFSVTACNGQNCARIFPEDPLWPLREKRTSRHYLILAILYSLGVEGWRIFGRHGAGPLFSFHTLVSHDFEDIRLLSTLDFHLLEFREIYCSFFSLSPFLPDK